MGLSSQTIELEKTRNRVKPQREETRNPRLEWKGGTKPTKGKKEERKRKNQKKLRNKPQMITQTVQEIRWNREVAQLLWIEKPETPTPPCRRQMEMWK